MNEENLIEKVLSNRITQMVFIGSILWGVITTIVLPLQKVQIQITQIQSDLTTQNKRYDVLSNAINLLTNRESVVESRLDNLKTK